MAWHPIDIEDLIQKERERDPAFRKAWDRAARKRQRKEKIHRSINKIVRIIFRRESK